MGCSCPRSLGGQLGGKRPPRGTPSVVCIRCRRLSLCLPRQLPMGLSIPPFHNSATAIAKLPRVPLLLLWVGISKAMLIKEQQLLYLGNGEINERTVASDLTAFCGISGSSLVGWSFMARCAVRLAGNIRSLRVGTTGLGGTSEPVSCSDGCCCPGPSATVPVHPSCLVNQSAHGCASQGNAMQLSQHRVVVKITGKCPLGGKSSTWQVKGECSTAFGLSQHCCVQVRHWMQLYGVMRKEK